MLLKKKGLFLLLGVIFLFSLINVSAYSFNQVGSNYATFPFFYSDFYQDPWHFYQQFPYWPDTIILVILFVVLMKALLESTKMLGERGSQVGGILGLMMGLGLSLYFNAINFHALLDGGPFVLAAIIIYLILLIYKWATNQQKWSTFGFLIAIGVLFIVLSFFFPNIVNYIPGGYYIIPLLLLLLIIGALASVFGGINSESAKPSSTNNNPANNSGKNNNPANNSGKNNEDNPKEKDDEDNSRPAGLVPPSTPKRYNSKDPPTDTSKEPPGLSPKGPKPPSPSKEPKKPSIPDEKEIFIDLSENFNGIRSQDGLGACTAFAATSIFEYVLSNGYGASGFYLSPLFLWYKTRESIGEINNNTGPRNCVVPMNNLLKDGVCMEDLWSFEGEDSNKWRTNPDMTAESDASTKKIIKVKSLDKNDPDQWVYQLLAKNPINIAIRLPKDFLGKYKEKFYKNPNPEFTYNGHAVVIVGYYSHYPNEDKGVKAFKIRNSWGVDWGENGYTWISADLLKKILLEDPLIISGWNKDKSFNNQFAITGRAVFDIEEQRINIKKTGAQLFKDNSLICPDHKFIVGVIAQIKNKLVVLNEIVVDEESDGRFGLKFKVDLKKIEKLTLLSGSPSLKGIDFEKLPSGFVVYKRSTDENDRELYYHIVKLEYSYGGRGGEGVRDESNKCSNFFDKNIPVSGIPITFSSKHTHETNVIIPVFKYHWMKDSQEKKDN